LDRLRQRGLVDRTRPYADSGSAPHHWWLTPTGQATATGSPPPRSRPSAPNPFFLTHTVAVADIYIALANQGRGVGLDVASWRRDEEGWEDWQSQGRIRRVAPDATVMLSAAGGKAIPAFIELDLATMTQGRLRAKAAAYFRYSDERIWKGRHPWCPMVLLLTTSNQRASTFLQSVAKLRPKRGWTRPASEDLVVAACATARNPAEAVTKAVWFTDIDTEPVTLAALVARQAAEGDRLTAEEAVKLAEQERQAPFKAASYFARYVSERNLGIALDDKKAARALEVAVDEGRPNFSEWVFRNREQLVSLSEWWGVGSYGPGSEPPHGVIAWLHSVSQEMWVEQAKHILQAPEQSQREPWGRALMSRLLKGELLDYWPMSRLGGPPHTIENGEIQWWPRYEEARSREIWQRRRQLPLLQRHKVTNEDLMLAYDAEHLAICADCSIRDKKSNDHGNCQVCHGEFKPITLTSMPTARELEQHLRVQLQERVVQQI